MISLFCVAIVSVAGQLTSLDATPLPDEIMAKWLSRGPANLAYEFTLQATADSRTPTFGESPPSHGERQWRILLEPERLLVRGTRYAISYSNRPSVLYVDEPSHARREFRHYLLNEQLASSRGFPTIENYIGEYSPSEENIASDFGALESAVISAVCLAIQPSSKEVIPSDTVKVIAGLGSPILAIKRNNHGKITKAILLENRHSYRILRAIDTRANGNSIQVDFSYPDETSIFPSQLEALEIAKGGYVFEFLTVSVRANEAPVSLPSSERDSQGAIVLTTQERYRRFTWSILQNQFAMIAVSLFPIFFALLLIWKKRLHPTCRVLLLRRSALLSTLVLLIWFSIRESPTASPGTSESYRRILLVLNDPQSKEEKYDLREKKKELAILGKELEHLRGCRFRWPWKQDSPSDHAEYLALVDLIGLSIYDIPSNGYGNRVKSQVDVRLKRVAGHLNGASPYSPPLKAKPWEKGD